MMDQNGGGLGVATIGGDGRRRSKTVVQPDGTVPYKVTESDRFTTIAARCNMTSSELMKLNKMMSPMVVPGQVICVPDREIANVMVDASSLTSTQNGVASPAPPGSDLSANSSLSELERSGSFSGESGRQSRRTSGDGSRRGSRHPSGMNQTDASGACVSLGLVADRLDREVRDQFIKVVSAKHITDGQGVVSGTLLVTTNTVMFDPDVSDHLVLEHGSDKFAVVAPISLIARIAIVDDIAAMIRSRASGDVGSDPPLNIYRSSTDAAGRRGSGDDTGLSSGTTSPSAETLSPVLPATAHSMETSKTSPITVNGAVDGSTETCAVHDTALFHELTNGQPLRKDTVAPEVVGEVMDSFKVTNDTPMNGNLTEDVVSFTGLTCDDDIHTSAVITNPNQLSMPSIPITSTSNISIPLRNEVSGVGGGAGSYNCEFPPMNAAGSFVYPEGFGVYVNMECGLFSRRPSDMGRVRDVAELPPVPDELLTIDEASSNGISLCVGGDYITRDFDEDDNDGAILRRATVGAVTASAWKKKDSQAVGKKKCVDFATQSTCQEPSTVGGTGSSNSVKNSSSSTISALILATHTALPVASHILDETGNSAFPKSAPVTPTKQYNTAQSLFDFGGKAAPGGGAVLGQFSKLKLQPVGASKVGVIRFKDAFSSANTGTGGGATENGINGAHPDIKSPDWQHLAMSYDMPDLFKPIHELVPKRAKRSRDMPWFLSITIGQPMKKISIASPIESYAKRRMRPMYWFSVPRDKVDPLYRFIVLNFAEVYGLEGEVNPASRGLAVLVNSNSSDLIDVDFEEREKEMRLRPSWSCAELDLLALPERSGESKILSDDHIKELSRHLPPRAIGAIWRLVYSSDKHGFSLGTLYRSMKGLDCSTLLVIKDAYGTVFGALLTCPLRITEGFSGSGESYLFSFKDTFKKYAWTGMNNFVFKGHMDSLCIGSGNGRFGLWLDGELNHGRTQKCQTFDNDILTVGEDFLIRNVEAWCFGPDRH